MKMATIFVERISMYRKVYDKLCAIFVPFVQSKSVKNIHGEVLLLVILQAYHTCIDRRSFPEA